MSQDYKYISIDVVLNRLLDKHSSGDSGDYADFLERLADYGKKNLPIDNVVEKKLEFQPYEAGTSWKKVIAVIWYRRIRNTALALLLATGIMFGVHTLTEIGLRKEYSAMSLPEATLPSEGNDNPGVVLESKNKDTSSHDKVKDQPYKGITDRVKIPVVRKPGSEKNDARVCKHCQTVLLISEADNDMQLQPSGIQKHLYLQSFEPKNISFISFPPVTQSGNSKNGKSHGLRPPSHTGFVIGFNITNSFQTSHSDISHDKPGTVNRNYEALSQNGKVMSHVMNYGISFEKSIFKEFKFSFGIQKLTIKQKQTTNYMLGEVPVYDMDGSIAGYISITPEMMNYQIRNRIDYISFPLNLMYGVRMSNTSGLQFRLGSGILGMVERHTDKFDYKSLELKEYKHAGSRLSVGNNMQYGLSYTRDLKNNIMLSFGFERQVLNRVTELSDDTEKIKSTISNITISLQYKL